MGRAPCCSRVGLHRGPWSAREDSLLTTYIQTHGEGGWKSLPKKAGLLRCGKSCRLRWMNYLRPDIKRGNIGAEEEDLIVRLHCLLGNRWSLIAGRLPGRTDNEIKNYWNTHLSKKLQKQGFVLGEARRRSTKSNIIENNKVSETGKEPKIYVPKPTRFLPRFSVVAEGESSQEGLEQMRVEFSDASSGESSDDYPEFDWYVDGRDDDDGMQAAGLDLEKCYNQLDLGFVQCCNLSLQADDAKLETLYLEYSQLLHSEREMDQFEESRIVL